MSTVVELATLRNLAVIDRIDIAIAAVNLFEFIITLELERRRIWAKKFTAVTWIFLINRYLAVAYSISMLLSLCVATEAVSSFWFTLIIFLPMNSDLFCRIQQSCRALLLIPCAIFLLMGLVQAAFSSLRVRALWPDQSILWPVIVFSLYLVPFGTDLWDYYSLKPLEPLADYRCSPQAGSATSRSASITASYLVVVVNRMCVIAADIIVLLSTWIRTFRHRQEMAKLGKHARLVTLFLRDGTISFLILLSLNVIQILMSAAPPWTAFSAINEFVHWPALYPIVISRFLLDLRQLDDFSETDDDRPSAPIAFSRRLTQDDARTSDLGGMLGNMGENLHCPFDKAVEDLSPPEEHVMDKAQSFLSEGFEKGVIVCEVEVIPHSEISP